MFPATRNGFDGCPRYKGPILFSLRMQSDWPSLAQEVKPWAPWKAQWEPLLMITRGLGNRRGFWFKKLLFLALLPGIWCQGSGLVFQLPKDMICQRLLDNSCFAARSFLGFEFIKLNVWPVCLCPIFSTPGKQQHGLF